MDDSVTYSAVNYTMTDKQFNGTPIRYGLMSIRAGFNWGSSSNSILWDKMKSAAKMLNPTEVTF